MKSCHTYLMVATLAVAGMGMSASAADNMGSTSGNNGINNNNSAQVQNGAGQTADESSTKAARNTLAKIVNDGVESGKFSTFTSYLAKADRERIGDVKHTNTDNLDSAIKQFRQDFKQKYNQDFDISADQLSNAMVYAGQDKNSATVTLSKPMLSSTPGDMTGAYNNGTTSTHNTANSTAYNSNNSNSSNNSTAGTTGAAADRTLNTTGNDQTVSNRSGDNSGAGLTSTSAGNRTGTATNGSNSNSTVHGNDVNATPGVVAGDSNTMANNTNSTNTNNTNNMNSTNNTNSVSSNNLNTMANANGVGMSSLTLNLVNEGHVMNAWRISDPQISAEQLKQNLTKHIQMLDDQKAAWPSDVNAAYQKVAYHVLSSFNDTAVASER